MREIPGPDRVRRLGVDGLVRFVCRRGARITRAKAAQVVETAREVLKLPEADWNAASAVLAADVTFLFALEEEIAKATAELSTVLPDTPAGVLTSLPSVGIVTASAYGAAIGDPARFKNAAGAYRASGLVPIAYESAGKSRRGNRISREGCQSAPPGRPEPSPLPGRAPSPSPPRRRRQQSDARPPA